MCIAPPPYGERSKRLNQLIDYVTARGWNSLFYNILFVAGFVALFIFNIFNSNNYKVPKAKALVFVTLTYLISTLWMFVMCWIENGFKGWGGNNIVRVFVWVPAVAWPLAKLFKLEWNRSCDLIAPCVPLIQAVSHWGCIFAGCCNGYPCSWGIISPVTQQRLFPIQPIEAIVALAVAIIVWRYEKKKNFEPDGLAYPLMLMLFGYSRVLLEFARDNEKIFLGMSSLALHALFMALVGTATYVTMKENKNKRKRRRVKC